MPELIMLTFLPYYAMLQCPKKIPLVLRTGIYYAQDFTNHAHTVWSLITESVILKQEQCNQCGIQLRSETCLEEWKSTFCWHSEGAKDLWYNVRRAKRSASSITTTGIACISAGSISTLSTSTIIIGSVCHILCTIIRIYCAIKVM